MIAFEAKRCIHARFCVLQQPGVFKANVVGPWIAPDDATTTAGLVATAENCPSGAIQYRRKDGGPEEAPPPVNLIQVRENGPLAFRGALVDRRSTDRHARDALPLRRLEQQAVLRRLAQGRRLHRHRRARDRGRDAARPARRRRLCPPAAQRAARRLRQSRGDQRHRAHDPQGDGPLFLPLRRLRATSPIATAATRGWAFRVEASFRSSSRRRRAGASSRRARRPRAEFLGPFAASRAARHFRRARDPLSDRRRLSAAQFRARRRNAHRLQCRDRARDLRGIAGPLHDPGARLGYAGRLARKPARATR